EELISANRWPVYFFESDTTGEKDFEEFFTDSEDVDLQRFQSIGVIRNGLDFDESRLDHFMDQINALRLRGNWSKADLVRVFDSVLPDFEHKETGKYLDGRM